MSKLSRNDLLNRIAELEREVAELRILEKGLRSGMAAGLERGPLGRMPAESERFRTILESVEDGYWEVNLNGYFTFANSAMCRISQRSHSELIGASGEAEATPEAREKMRRLFTKVYRSGENEKLSDFEMVMKDGETRFIEISVSLIKNESGEPIGFRGISRDITERKNAERALRESEQRYRTVLEANPDPVMVYNLKNEIIYFNPAFEKIFGWTLDLQKGKPLCAFVPKSKSGEALEVAGRIMAGENITGMETERYTRNGELIPVSISGSVYKSIDGEPVGSMVSLRDIRDKKKMEAQLINAQKFESIGTLAGGIAHDFNNLLMGIQGNASLARFDLPENHPVNAFLDNIEKSIESGSRLTRQLIGYARKGRYEVKPVDVNRMIKNISETFGRTCKTISIYEDLAQDLLPVSADEGQMEQVFLNMLANSNQAMPGGGNIFVKTRNVGHEEIDDSAFRVNPGRYVLISITDSGEGIDQEAIAHIFDPFFTTRGMGRGSGLGLASSYGIIKGHGGYVNVSSKLGEGTTFTIYFPSMTEKTPATTEKTGEKKETSSKETILMVDDEKMILDVGSLILQKLGYHVLLAESGEKAIEIVRKTQSEIHLVLLDMIMPGIGGGEVFDIIKAVKPGIKVLLSSGYSVEGQAKKILDRGCNGFIQKPFNVGQLSEKIRSVLDS